LVAEACRDPDANHTMLFIDKSTNSRLGNYHSLTNVSFVYIDKIQNSGALNQFYEGSIGRLISQVVSHEIGHWLLGNVHHGSVGNLMYEHAQGGKTLEKQQWDTARQN